MRLSAGVMGAAFLAVAVMLGMGGGPGAAQDSLAGKWTRSTNSSHARPVPGDASHDAHHPGSDGAQGRFVHPPVPGGYQKVPFRLESGVHTPQVIRCGSTLRETLRMPVQP